MKVINFVWRSPEGSIIKETIPCDKFKIHTDGPWIKLNKVDEGGGIVRILPAQKVEIIEFVDQEEPSKIIAPSGPVPVPRDFQTS